MAFLFMSFYIFSCMWLKCHHSYDGHQEEKNKKEMLSHVIADKLWIIKNNSSPPNGILGVLFNMDMLGDDIKPSKT